MWSKRCCKTAFWSLYLATGCILFLITSTDSAWQRREESNEYWNEMAQDTLRKVLQRSDINKPAKNVIIFIGDGLGITTLTAGRIFKGQMTGQTGEETVTALDKFENVGLSKIYAVDKQSPDSSSTATAILCGVKTKFKVVGINGKGVYNSCSSVKGNEVYSILEESARVGKSTGIVTTTEVQHATPASSYAHTASRNWMSDWMMSSEAKNEGCKDISLQLLEMGRKINVVLGGGRALMKPVGIMDEEYRNEGTKGKRQDNRNLINEWLGLHPSDKARYVWGKRQFDDINPNNTDYLMGLFQPYEMRFEHNRQNDVAGEPSISEMTRKAIQILQKNDKGFFLLVEGGKIDHAHHQNRANIALREFLEFEKAIETAVNMTSETETLIVATADHGHVFTLGGYSDRGNPLNGFAKSQWQPSLATDRGRYTSIAYANGPGYQGRQTNSRNTYQSQLRREALGLSTTDDIQYQYQTAVPLSFETHSSEDVFILARGPMSHLFSGVHEQNYIAHAMKYASCVGQNKSLCDQFQTTTADTTTQTFSETYTSQTQTTEIPVLTSIGDIDNEQNATTSLNIAPKSTTTTTGKAVPTTESNEQMTTVATGPFKSFVSNIVQDLQPRILKKLREIYSSTKTWPPLHERYLVLRVIVNVSEPFTNDSISVEQLAMLTTVRTFSGGKHTTSAITADNSVALSTNSRIFTSTGTNEQSDTTTRDFISGTSARLDGVIGTLSDEKIMQGPITLPTASYTQTVVENTISARKSTAGTDASFRTEAVIHQTSTSDLKEIISSTTKTTGDRDTTLPNHSFSLGDIYHVFNSSSTTNKKEGSANTEAFQENPVTNNTRPVLLTDIEGTTDSIVTSRPMRYCIAWSGDGIVKTDDLAPPDDDGGGFDPHAETLTSGRTNSSVIIVLGTLATTFFLSTVALISFVVRNRGHVIQDVCATECERAGGREGLARINRNSSLESASVAKVWQ